MIENRAGGFQRMVENIAGGFQRMVENRARGFQRMVENRAGSLQRLVENRAPRRIPKPQWPNVQFAVLFVCLSKKSCPI